MKKILFVVAAVALMAMVSCNKENANDAPQVKEPSVIVEFSASISMGAEDTNVKPQSSAATRTTVDHSVLKNPKTLWLGTDKISINGVAFKVKELINGGASAIFVNEGDLPADFGAPYTAVYPHAAYADGGDGKITKITLPSTQTANAGHFPEDAVCAAAYSDDAVLKFKNVASVLMFQVAKACQTVTISSDNALAGTVKMEPNGDDAVPTFGEGTEKTVTIEGPFEVGQNYYVAVLPGTKNNFVVRHDGYLSKNAASVTIARSGFANMGTLPAPVASTKYGIASTFQTNEWKAEEAIVMYEDLSNNVVLKGVQLYKDDQFKVVADKSWDENYGVGGQNVTVDKNGLFDITFNKSTKAITATCVKEITDIKVELTVLVDRPWNSVNLHLWEEKGQNDVTITGSFPGVKLGTSKGEYTYEIDGKYIGKQMGYILSNNNIDNTSDAYFTLQSRKGNTISVNAYDLYLKPSSNWKSSNAWFAIYCWSGSANAWNKMNKVTNDIYGAYLPSGYQKGCDMKFVRMNSGDTNTLGWGNKWNESSNIKSPSSTSTKVCYNMNANGWDDMGGSWVAL